MKTETFSWKRTLLIIFIAVLALVVAAAGYGLGQLLNPAEQAPPPPTQTQLATFAPPAENQATATDLPNRVAAEIPDPSGYAWTMIVDGFERPIDLTHSGDGSGRLFVVEQAGVIRILENEQILSIPFLDIRDRVGSGGNEQGLLGLAFHPNYVQNGYFFVNYTDLNGHTVIARYRLSSDPYLADPSTETRLLQVSQPYANHNGGGLAFGPDGYLYIGLGDGGLYGDPQGNGQKPDSLLGKLLRIDVDSGEPYAIPPDNPFVSAGGAQEVWAQGLRNPWRFSFDPLTGDLYIGDVGQDQWEEIDFLPAGSPGGVNFGWDYFEAFSAYEGQAPQDRIFVEPVAAYSHQEGGCSVTGGVVYRGAALPEWQGVYLYGDFCSGKIWGLLPTPDGSWQNTLLFTLNANIAGFGLDQFGEVYITDLGGPVFKLIGQ